jgi:hypothetical protein
MPGVFISYRREDSSGYAGRLFDILSTQFGRENTYMDLDTIEGGDDFTAVIHQKINVSDVLVAVIGTRWLTSVDENGKRRLDKPGDFVRIEIAEALKRGIRVIPVLVGGAAIPRADDLPEDLRTLCERQAVEIRDSHFHPDAQQLIEALERDLQDDEILPRHAKLKRFIVPALLSFGGVIIVVLGILLFRQPKPAAPAATPVEAELKRNTKKIADIAGKWTATVKYDWGDTYQENFQFEVDGHELSGMVGFLGDREGDGRAIMDGKIAGARISFMTRTLLQLAASSHQGR